MYLLDTLDTLIFITKHQLKGIVHQCKSYHIVNQLLVWGEYLTLVHKHHQHCNNSKLFNNILWFEITRSGVRRLNALRETQLGILQFTEFSASLIKEKT
jgi:hypothetical protein